MPLPLPLPLLPSLFFSHVCGHRVHLNPPQKCLRYEPGERESAAQLLKHPYFHGFRESFEDELRECMEKDRELDDSTSRLRTARLKVRACCHV